MRTVGTTDTDWANLAKVLQSNAAAEGMLAPLLNNGKQERQRWQAVLNDWLLMWAQDPSQMEDEGIVPPSADIIQLACQLARDLRDAGVPGPQRVAATGEGGIVFVRQTTPLLSTLEVGADGSIELAVFRDSHLVSRQRLR